MMAVVGRRALVFALSLLPTAPPAQNARYDEYASTYDDLDGGAVAEKLGFVELRREMVGRARGRVLEVGAGTGLNLPYYDWERVSTLVTLDQSAGMLALANARAKRLGIARSTRTQVGDVAQLPYDDDSFDTVVDTFSLCVFEEPQAALAEMARVLKPSGRVLLVEHQRAGGLLGAYQDVTAAAVTPISKGCVWNQNVRALAGQAGLRVVDSKDAVLGTIATLELEPITGSGKTRAAT